jgi:hypothetical protein
MGVFSSPLFNPDLDPILYKRWKAENWFNLFTLNNGDEMMTQRRISSFESSKFKIGKFKFNL